MHRFVLLAVLSFWQLTLRAHQVLLRTVEVGERGVAVALAADNSGNVFIVSALNALNFSTVSALLPLSGPYLIRVTKIGADGTVSASLDLPGQGPAAIACDPQGNVVIVGTVPVVTESGAAVPGDFQLVNPLFPAVTTGGAYVLKLDSQLHSILFSTFLSTYSAATAVAVDSAGNIFVAGTSGGIDFPTTAGAFQTSSGGAFLAEISPSGNKLLYSTYFGGVTTSSCNPTTNSCVHAPALTTPSAVTVSPSGAIVLAGYTNAYDMTVTPGTLGAECLSCYQTSSVGFLAEFSPGSPPNLAWSTFVNLGKLPSLTESVGGGIGSVAFAGNGDLIIGGVGITGLATTPGALQREVQGQFSGFVGRVANSGTSLVWLTAFGGSNNPLGERGYTCGVDGLVLDSQGHILITGFSEPNQVPPLDGVPLLGASYVARLSSDGTAMDELYVGPTFSAGAGLALTPQGSFVSLGKAGTLWMESATTSGPSLLAVANSADGPVSGIVVRAEIVSLYGVGIGPATALPGQVVKGVYVSSLGGYQVLFDGVAAPLLYAGSSQINAVVPQEVANRITTHVQLVTPAGMFDGPTLAVGESQPYIFQSSAVNLPLDFSTGLIADALNQDGSVNSPQNPAKPGQIVCVFISGGGSNPYFPRLDGTVVSDTNFHNAPDPVAVFTDLIAGNTLQNSLEVLYAGDAPEMVLGVMQINFRLPQSLNLSYQAFQFAVQVGHTLGGIAAVAVGQ